MKDKLEKKNKQNSPFKASIEIDFKIDNISNIRKSLGIKDF